MAKHILVCFYAPQCIEFICAIQKNSYVCMYVKYITLHFISRERIETLGKRKT